MSRIAPLTESELPEELRASLAKAKEIMGFSANDVLTMARWPELLRAMEQLVMVIYGPGALDPLLKRLIGTITSGAAGCRYCQAHSAHGAAKMTGGDNAKIADVWSYPTSAHFSDAERAALDLALAAGTQPNAVTDTHFATLRKFYSEQEIVEMMGVIGLFGFLNRWNDSLATPLETAPLEFATKTLNRADWEVGKHRAPETARSG